MQPTIDPSADGLEWARRLVRINTVSHHSNLELIECVADHLRALKVPLRLTWDADRRKANIFATLGEGKPNGIILSGHTDTVPWDGQAWSTDPLDPVIRDGRLYGRGSADMKGFIGLSVAHASHFLEADLPFAVHYAFSYDEEIGCVGVQGLIADLRDENLEPRLCVVGEPTRMIPAIAHKGIQRWRCCVRGKAAHSAQTPFAVNAIEAGARLVAHIADMADRWRAEGPFNRDYDVPHSTAAVAVIAGGIADNVVPEDCRIHYEFRNLPGTDDVAMQRQVFERAAELEPAMKSIEPTAGFSFENFASCPSFLTTPDRAAVRLAQYLAETEATTVVAFGTEAGLFQRAGIDTVVCGPGDISQAHQADEFVSLEQLARCERFLLRLKNSETFL